MAGYAEPGFRAIAGLAPAIAGEALSSFTATENAEGFVTVVESMDADRCCSLRNVACRGCGLTVSALNFPVQRKITHASGTAS
jgi:hypothetical protein